MNLTFIHGVEKIQCMHACSLMGVVELYIYINILLQYSSEKASMPFYYPKGMWVHSIAIKLSNLSQIEGMCR